MTKTKRIVIQLVLTLLAILSILFLFFWELLGGTNDYAFFIYDEITFVNMFFVALVAWLVLPTLYAFSWLRRKTHTPGLDKTTRFILYASALTVLATALFHFEYILMNNIGSEEWNFFWIDYRQEQYFWLYIIWAVSCYLIPAVLFFVAARIGLNKKTAEIKQ